MLLAGLLLLATPDRASCLALLLHQL